MNKIYRFIANNLNTEEEVNSLYFETTIKQVGFTSKDKFLDFNKKFVESLNENSTDFYLELMKKIKSKKIELRDAEDPTYWNIAGWFYFNPSGKLIILPGHAQNTQDVTEHDDFYAKFRTLCDKDQVRISSDYFGIEYELNEYKYNHQTNRFMLVHPK
jgi:hypothetical protein